MPPDPQPRPAGETRDVNRCAICGWPLAEMRPLPTRYNDRARAELEYGVALPPEAPPSAAEAEIAHLRKALAAAQAESIPRAAVEALRDQCRVEARARLEPLVPAYKDEKRGWLLSGVVDELDRLLAPRPKEAK